MALVSEGYRGSVTVADNGGGRSTLRYDLVAATIADALAAMGVIQVALAAVTDAVVVGYTVSEVFVEETIVLPADGVQNENQAVVSSRIDTEGEKWAIVRIPAPNIGVFAGTSGEAADRIDGGDAALGTYLGLFATSGGVATISDGETLLAPGVANTKGKRAHRASRLG